MTTPTPKEPQVIEHDGKFFRRHRGAWQFSTNRDGGVWHYSVESDIEAWLNKVEFLAAGRDAAEKLVSAQHDALVAMKSERDAWEHRAEVAERENGEALSMLAFTGEPSSLWQAAAAARAKLAEAEQKARYESDVAAQAMAAKDAAVRELAQEKEGSAEWEEESAAWNRKCRDVQEECDELRAKLHALTAHMNQVHETLGGSDTVLTLEAAQHVVAKLAEAERERDRKASWVEEQADIISRGRAENAQLRAKLDAAEKACTRYDNLLSTVRDHLPLCVSDGGFADHSQEMVDRELVEIRATIDHALTATTAQGE